MAGDLPLLSENDVEYWFDFFKSLVTLPEKKKEEAKDWKHQGNRQYTNREIKAFLSCFGEEFELEFIVRALMTNGYL